jgi:hypothetical protein
MRLLRNALLLCSFAAPIWPAAIVFESAGDLATVTATRDAFRTAIGGGTTAGANGLFGGVRREINWDGVPDALSAPNNLPANFFNVNSPRGAVFSTAGTGFQVSANSGVAPVEFGNINATYPTLFAPFSPQRLFTALGSNVMDMNFFVPGTTTPATTNAFGVVFSDVDLAAGTSIQFFDDAGNSIFSRSVLTASGNETFSFLGVQFSAGERVGRVRITSGNSALGPNENLPTIDMVVMDDFLYAEPTAVPEPATILLTGAGLLACFLRRR